MAAVRTSKQWAAFPSFVVKLNKSLPTEERVSAKAAATLLKRAGAAQLRSRGIWVTFFGAKFMPIVLTNQGFAKAWQAAAAQGIVGPETTKPPCTCTARAAAAAAAEAGGRTRAEKATKRFYSSHDYNAGRHRSTASVHHLNCVSWTPPTSGHLHSWRRGYEK